VAKAKTEAKRLEELEKQRAMEADKRTMLREKKESIDRYVKFKRMALDMIVPVMIRAEAVIEKKGHKCNVLLTPDMEELRSTKYEDLGNGPDLGSYEVTLEVEMKAKKGRQHGNPKFKIEVRSMPEQIYLFRNMRYVWKWRMCERFFRGWYHTEVDLEEITKDLVERELAKWFNEVLRLKCTYELY